MVTWSRVIETFESLPDLYKSFVHQLQAENGEFPYVVFTPGAEKSIRNTPELVLCSTKNAVYFLENRNKELEITSFPFERIRDLEVGSILLFSWLTVFGTASNGEKKSKTVEFNAVSYPHFIPFINAIRKAPGQVDAQKLDLEKKKFNYLNSLTYKFMNYGRKSLKGDEAVLQVVWEPEIRGKLFSRLGLPLYRTYTCAYMLVLTNRELIMIREDEISPLVKGNRYGGIWRYIPHSSLCSLSMCETERNLLELTITLTDENTLSVLFHNENREGVEQLMNKALNILQSVAAPVF